MGLIALVVLVLLLLLLLLLVLVMVVVAMVLVLVLVVGAGSASATARVRTGCNLARRSRRRSSEIAPPCAARGRSAPSRRAPYISLVSPLHLPCISAPSRRAPTPAPSPLLPVP